MSFSCQPVEQASKQREGAVIDARKEGMRARERQQATTTNHSLSRGSLLSINRIKSMISSTNREHQCDVDVCHTHNVLVGVGRLCIHLIWCHGRERVLLVSIFLVGHCKTNDCRIDMRCPCRCGLT